MIINEAIYISKREDNIAVALREITASETFKLQNETLKIEQRVPAGANLALKKIKAGGELKAFGIPFATARNNLK